MNFKMPNIELGDEHVDTIMDRLDAMSQNMAAAQKVINDLDKLAYVCSLQMHPKEIPEAHVIAGAWTQLASTVDLGTVHIENHYTSGPETEKPWGEHLFKCWFVYGGVCYFCLMSGRELDSAGFEISDKEALMHGALQS